MSITSQECKFIPIIFTYYKYYFHTSPVDSDSVTNYYETWVHIVPYAAGLLAGDYLFRFERQKAKNAASSSTKCQKLDSPKHELKTGIDFAIEVYLPLFCAVISMACNEWYRYIGTHKDLTPLQSSLFIAFVRVLWTAAVACIILMCATNRLREGLLRIIS